MGHDLCQGNRLVRCPIETFTKILRLFTKDCCCSQFNILSKFHKLFTNICLNSESLSFIFPKTKYVPNAKFIEIYFEETNQICRLSIIWNGGVSLGPGIYL